MFNGSFDSLHSTMPGTPLNGSISSQSSTNTASTSQINLGASNYGNNNNGQIPQLWMGELDQRWDELTIKQIWTSLLSSMGIVVHSVKSIKDKQSSQLGLANAGYCFIRFHNFEDASKVLNLFNGKPIPGTNNQYYFRLNWSSANIQAAAVAAAASSSLPLPTVPNSTEYSVFVGDLPQNINEQILLQTFKSKYPSCTSVKIMVDQSTGNIKGYGFVKFLNEEEQKKALIEMQGYVLLGRAIRVSTASKSSNNNSSSNDHQNNGMSSSNTSINSLPTHTSVLVNNNTNILPNGLSIQNTYQQQKQQQPQQQQQLQQHTGKSLLQPLPQNASLQYFNDPANTTVFIGGLNIPFSENQMYDLFSKFGNISYVKIPLGKNCGFVQYFLRESAELAINEMQGYDIGGGCRIRVSWGARAAQRSWFARQLQMQQQQQHTQVQQVQQRQILNHYSQVQQNHQLQHQPHHQQQQQQQQPPYGQYSNDDIKMLLNMNKTQNISNTLGLYDSYVNLNDTMLDMNGYSINQLNFENEQIPYSTNIANHDSNTKQFDYDYDYNEEAKLNKLLLAARDGNLDQLDLGSNIYGI